MRLLAVVLAFGMCLTLSGQGKGGGKAANPFATPPKNLKILKPTGDWPTFGNATMNGFRAALGQQCTFCHVAGEFSSDDNPNKSTARAMLRMVDEVNAKFPDGKAHVSCWTCHRGKTEPELVPAPAGDAGGRGRGAAAPPPQQ